ncbi:GTP-binding protein [Pseudoxanthomonas sp.]|uniref:GTP-binding protein n=1 Tax=Pseudoxanthomonas sp. TaxID=1871049 RepID=UPI002626650E|nr:GTP-binding protein [Pseudoxanthomonas sp.]WDS35225.1 MAG: GTP-binding protein [Pseudoxanthomonas sp.]
MREHKIVVLGSMGAGKSTLVRTVANGRVVDTDVHNTDASLTKALTTVAMDYADVDLPNGDRLRLVGTPGQARFEFIWPILLTGAAGIVVLVDGASDQAAAHFDTYLDALAAHAPQVPTVVGISRLDLKPDASLDPFHGRLEQRGRPLPVLPLDAREVDQILMVMDVLMSEIESTELVGRHD